MINKYSFLDKLFQIPSVCLLSALLLICGNQVIASDNSKTLSLNGAVIVTSSDLPIQVNASEFLRDEIESRTGIKLEISGTIPSGDRPAIVLGYDTMNPAPPEGLSVPAKAESYAIWTDTSGKAPVIYLSGRDDRGVLFAAGRLLRLMYLSENYISIPGGLYIASAPADAIRAQQIISNTQCEDGFVDWRDDKEVQQFVRDMVIFGTNGFEPTVPELVDGYLESLGIELYIKLKCQEIIDYNEKSDQELLGIYSHIKGIDHITTYGGDASGSVKPQLFFPQMERVLPLILKGQPGVKWWYSNQCLEDHAKDEDDYIFSYIKSKKPSWLYGMVYGPWTKRGITEIRADLPAQYAIRHFPEICHPRWCQYPIPGWDRIYAIVWPRNQSIYMMPSMHLDIYKATRKNTVGALPYNHTGVYNDLNKFTWSMAGWNPEITVDDLLYDYSRVFFAHDFIKYPGERGNMEITKEVMIRAGTEAVVEGLRLLEQNWTGQIKDNNSTEKALAQWEHISDCMGGPSNNWRVKMYLFKARIDAQIKRKYDLEMQLEAEAYNILGSATQKNLNKTIGKALKHMSRIDSEFQSAADFKKDLKALGLTDGFGDIDQIIENIYTPFNDRLWIESELANATGVSDIQDILNYEDPGEGGFYDNPGIQDKQAHLVRQKTWKEDPGFIYSPIEWVDNHSNSDLRHSQHTHALCRYDTPLQMHWEGLDSEKTYKIRVVYNGPFDISIKCKTDEGLMIHDFIAKGKEESLEFMIPQESTRDGDLGLEWSQDIENNVLRGVSVSEIWLMKVND